MTPDEARAVLAANVGSYRRIRRLDQEDVAENMRQCGHPKWLRVTVSEIERGRRNVTAPELVSLAELFDVGIYRLLDPAGPI